MAIKKQKLLTGQDYKKKIDKARNSNKNNLKNSFTSENQILTQNIEEKSYLYIIKYILYFNLLTLIVLFIIAPKPKAYYYFSNNIEQQSIFIPSSIFNQPFILDSTYFDKISLKQIEKEKFLVLCSINKKTKCQQYKITKEDSLISTFKHIIKKYL